MKHLSSEIHKFGLELVQKSCQQKGIEFETRPNSKCKHWIKMLNTATNKKRFYPVFISVKTHKYEWSTKVTGKNTEAIERIREKAREEQIPSVLLFVDAKDGFIYGDFLGKLLQPKRIGALTFPKQKVYHNQSITFFAIDKLPVFAKIGIEDLTILKNMHIQNGTNENQKTIFD